jgi:hypothetical protein
MDKSNAIVTLKTLAKVALIAAVVGLAAGALTVEARRLGFAISDGVMMGIIIGAAGGLAGYFTKPLAKKD